MKVPHAAVQPCELPRDALLQRHRASGAYTDCYSTDVAHAVSHADYVEAFRAGRLLEVLR